MSVGRSPPAATMSAAVASSSSPRRATIASRTPFARESQRNASPDADAGTGDKRGLAVSCKSMAASRLVARYCGHARPKIKRACAMLGRPHGSAATQQRLRRRRHYAQGVERSNCACAWRERSTWTGVTPWAASQRGIWQAQTPRRSAPGTGRRPPRASTRSAIVATVAATTCSPGRVALKTAVTGRPGSMPCCEQARPPDQAACRAACRPPSSPAGRQRGKIEIFRQPAAVGMAGDELHAPRCCPLRQRHL